MRTLTATLALVLAISIGWYVLQARDAGSSAPRPAPMQAAQATSSTTAPIFADRWAARAEGSGSHEMKAGEVTGEPVVEEAIAASDRQRTDRLMMDLPRTDSSEPTPARVQPATQADAHGYPIIAADLPSYLAFAAQPDFPPPSPSGCKHAFQLLAEMAQGSRDETWAPRIEKNLRALLGRHPLGFRVSITCRADICQITAIGPVAAIRENEAEYGEYWSNFMQGLRSAPSASEFATWRFFSAKYPDDPSQDVSGYVLATVEHASPTEPPDCARF